MNLEELQAVRETERAKDSLQHLRDSFYGDVADYIADLREGRDRAAVSVDDPFEDPDIRRLTDEIETAEGTVEAIYERRVGKLVKLASFEAAGMPADGDGLTVEERTLFDEIVDRIEENRRCVLDVLAGDAGEVEGTSEDSNGESTDPSGSSARETDSVTPVEEGASSATPGSEQGVPDGGVSDAMGGGGANPPAVDDPERSEGSDDSLAVDRATVRITADVGEILGVDERAYELSADDVVSLPVENADPLLRRNAAEPLD